VAAADRREAVRVKHLLLRLEPVIWLLFGLGILVGTILLTGWLLVVGVAVPLGLASENALVWMRVHPMVATPIGRLLLLAMIVLPLWKGAHHLRTLAIDFGGASRDPAVASLLYGLALLGSALGVLAVIRL
jgi:fumarate reductase subunit D